MYSRRANASCVVGLDRATIAFVCVCVCVCARVRALCSLPPGPCPRRLLAVRKLTFLFSLIPSFDRSLQGAPAKLLCSGCRLTRYCSPECQVRACVGWGGAGARVDTITLAEDAWPSEDVGLAPFVTFDTGLFGGFNNVESWEALPILKNGSDFKKSRFSNS